METNLITGAQYLVNYSFLIALQILFILIIRKHVRQYFGAVIAYRLWLLPLFCAPLYFINWDFIKIPVGDNLPLSNLAVNSGNTIIINNFKISSLLNNSVESINTPSIWLVLALIWIIGVSIYVIRQIYRAKQLAYDLKFLSIQLPKYETIHLLKKTAIKKIHQVRILNGITSPVLYGLFQPTLLIPENFVELFDEDQRFIILSHEAIHYERKDNLWNLLEAFLKTVFWFNPFVHIASHFYRLDQELSCDAQALLKCNDHQGKRFASTLLESISLTKQKQSRFYQQYPTLSAWNNFSEIKERVLMINQPTRYPQHSIKTKLFRFTLLFTVIFSTGLFTKYFGNIDKIEGNFFYAIANAQEERVDQSKEASLNSEFSQKLEEAQSLLENNRFSLALSVLDELKEQNNGKIFNPNESFLIGSSYANIYSEEKDYISTISTYEEILKIEGLKEEHKHLALRQLGHYNFYIGHYAEAISFWEQWLELVDEPIASIHNRLGIAYYALDDYSSAITNILWSMEIDNSNGVDTSKTTYATLYILYDDKNDKINTNRTLNEMITNFSISNTDDASFIGFINGTKIVMEAMKG